MTIAAIILFLLAAWLGAWVSARYGPLASA
jgi:heme A synthase